MSRKRDFDAIVIGGGINGLVAAGLLQRRGLKTLVLEAGGGFGGLAAQVDGEGASLGPAFAQVGSLSPKVAAALDLGRHGLAAAPQKLDQMIQLPSGDGFLLPAGDPQAQRSVLGRFSAGDAEKLPAFRARLSRLAGALRPYLDRKPAAVGRPTWEDRLELLRFGLSLRRLGQRDMRDLLRIIAMNEADLLEEVFESEAAESLFALDGVLGNRFGPRSPNTVFTLLYRWATAYDGESGAPLGLEGGAATLAGALVKAAKRAGVALRAESEVTRIIVEDDRIAGVRLAKGEEIAAPLVLSSLHPKRSCLELLGPQYLDADWVRNLRHARGLGVTAALSLTLSGLPEGEASAAELLRRRLVFAGGVKLLEEAHDKAKYGELPENPPFEARICEAGGGRYLLQATLQYCPQNLREGSWREAGKAVQASALARLEQAMPGLGARIEESRFFSPDDLEAKFGLPGAHWHHLELGLDQIYLLRPVPGAAQYRMPVEGLLLCGAGCHPGGGLGGSAGANAAAEALRLWKAKNMKGAA